MQSSVISALGVEGPAVPFELNYSTGTGIFLQPLQYATCLSFHEMLCANRETHSRLLDLPSEI